MWLAVVTPCINNTENFCSLPGKLQLLGKYLDYWVIELTHGSLDEPDIYNDLAIKLKHNLITTQFFYLNFNF